MEKAKKVTIYLPQGLTEKVRELADRDTRTVSGEYTYLITRGIEKTEGIGEIRKS